MTKLDTLVVKIMEMSQSGGRAYKHTKNKAEEGKSRLKSISRRLDNKTRDVADKGESKARRNLSKLEKTEQGNET